MNLKKHTVQCALLCLLVGMSGCGKEEAVPTTVPTVAETTAPTLSYYEVVTDLAMVVTEQDFQELELYTNLKTLDLTGSTCYEAIGRYMKFHPEVDVTYTVSLGTYQGDPEAEELTLTPEDYDYDLLLENLQYFPELQKLHLSQLSISLQELAALREAYPQVEITYTVTLLGDEYPWDTQSMDLSFITPDQVPGIVPAFALLENLETVELMDENGKSNLEKSDVKILIDAVPETNFHYTFDLFGKTISTDDETVEFKNQNIGNEGEPQLREALDIMTGCKSFRLIDCGLDNEVLAKLREDYPRTKVVWRVQFGKYSAMTDTDTIRAVKNVFDNTCYNMRYCNEVKYMDLGHNESLTDLSFVGFMPELEILIISGCSVSDLSGFENCKKLEFLEMAYCGKVTDISPLAGCESLTDLNISYTKVQNLLPLDGLPLEHFCAQHTWVQPKEQKIFQEIHPDCWTQFYGSQPYGKGWRYEQDGRTHTPGYARVREVFDLDSIPQAWIDAENDALKKK